MRGWGIEAVVALAPQQLWWKALSLVFQTPEVVNLTEPVALETVAIAFDDYIYWCPEAKERVCQWMTGRLADEKVSRG